MEQLLISVFDRIGINRFCRHRVAIAINDIEDKLSGKKGLLPMKGVDCVILDHDGKKCDCLELCSYLRGADFNCVRINAHACLKSGPSVFFITVKHS
jgi:hypothetical protein